MNHSESLTKLATALVKCQAMRDLDGESGILKHLARVIRGPQNRKDESLTAAFMNRLAFGWPGHCWFWTGSRSEIGYGMFAAARTSYGCPEVTAHRISWYLHNGPIPEGLKVLHRCDVRSCVNPEHLFLGTQMDNVRDCIQKGRFRIGGGLRGQRNGISKLTDESVKALRWEYIDGASQRSLAIKYGVSPMTINRAVHRQTWNHV